MKRLSHYLSILALAFMLALTGCGGGGGGGDDGSSNNEGDGGSSDSSGEPTVLGTVDFPGSVYLPSCSDQATLVEGMTATGQLWGRYCKSDGSSHGYITSGESYVGVEPPGADYSELVAAQSGQFYGNYYAGGVTKGFVYDGGSGSYTIIECPGAAETTIAGVDASGKIFGYCDSTGMHGFVKNGSNYDFVVYPGASMTDVAGITASGVIVGPYSYTHGFALIAGGYANIDVLGGSQFEIKGVADNGLIWVTALGAGMDMIFMTEGGGDKYGLTPDCSGSCTDITGRTLNTKTGRIAGWYKDGRKPYQHGFVMEGTTYTSSSHSYTVIDYPDPNGNSVSGTYAEGTSDAGAVFGGFFDAAGKEHGYVKIGDKWSEPIDYPGATATWVEGYSDATGQVWGSYVATDGRQYNYVLNGGLSFQ